MKNMIAAQRICVVGFALSCLCDALHAQLVVGQNAYVTSTGSDLQIVLENADLVNHGIIAHASGTFKFIGNGPGSISGAGTTSLYNLELSKTNGTALRLAKPIVVKNQLRFVSGLLDLNGYTVDLLSTGALLGETEESRITTSSSGHVLTTVNLSQPFSVNPGNLGAVISSTQDLGFVTISRGHQAQPNVGNSDGINRYFDISPANNTALNATLRFNYFDAELNGLPETNLVLYKRSDNTAWTNQSFTQRDAFFNYVEKTAIADFSRWTLGVSTSACETMRVYYQDFDGDGFGNAGSVVTACSQPPGYVTDNSDCDDNNASINPAAKESCNGLDDDCDGIVDEECNTMPTLSIDDATAFESQGAVAVTVFLSAPSASTVSVRYKTVNGTATHPKDYTRVSGDLVFAPGETSKTIVIQIKPDNIAEPNEWFDVQLSDPQNATIADGTGSVTITEVLLTNTQMRKQNGVSFDVTVSRNPTTDYFLLGVKTEDPELLQLRITDINGRLVEKRDKVTSLTIAVGSRFQTGVYFAEIKQGANRKVVKLIKL